MMGTAQKAAQLQKNPKLRFLFVLPRSTRLASTLSITSLDQSPSSFSASYDNLDSSSDPPSRGIDTKASKSVRTSWISSMSTPITGGSAIQYDANRGEVSPTYSNADVFFTPPSSSPTQSIQNSIRPSIFEDPFSVQYIYYLIVGVKTRRKQKKTQELLMLSIRLDMERRRGRYGRKS